MTQWLVENQLGNAHKSKCIFLSSCNLNEVPQDIFSISSPKSLVLSFNNILSIPPETGTLTSLQSLVCSHNRIETIPDELSALKQLRTFSIGFNKITSFNDKLTTSLISLEDLNLEHNYLSNIGNLNYLTTLQYLSLEHNLLGPFLDNIPDFIFPPFLKDINLSSNILFVCPQFSNILSTITVIDIQDNRIKEISKTFLEMGQLTNLNIGGNEISELPEGFENHWINLSTLSIAYNSFTSLPDGIAKFPKLQSIDVRGNLFEVNDYPMSLAHLVLLSKGITGEHELSDDDNYAFMNIEYENLIPDEITPNLYLGCLMCAKNKTYLSNLGITHVLTALPGKPLYPHIFQYKIIEIEDDLEEDIFSHFEASVKFINDAVASGGKVLVHCQAGISRSATLVTAYIMQLHKLNRNDGIKYVKQRRSIIEPNDAFYSQLQKWHNFIQPNTTD